MESETIASTRQSAGGIHVVFGNGPVGSAAARYLLQQGHTVRMASRSGRRPAVIFDDLDAQALARLQLVKADARDRESVGRASAGASHIYHCMNVLYQHWQTELPPMQESLVEAALREGAVLAVTENLYMYARGVDVIDESTPEVPPTRKGALRKRLHEQLVEAGRDRGLKWTAVRASDYYGPGATFQSMFGTEFLLQPLFSGRRPRIVGRLDVPHSLAYVGDYGRALAIAALDSRAWGRSWIVPNDPPRTSREVGEVFFRAAGRPGRLGTIPRPVIVGMGLVSPLVREIVEMLYQKEEPYVVDGGEFAARFSFSPTPLEEGVRRTLAWYEKTLAGSGR
jgi:nucleoside-diphosphate-sugar epimerase